MKVEFSNNGITDSLTGAPAPRNFFENLAREIANSKRKYQPLAIMTIKYLPSTPSVASETEIIDLARVIKKNMRKGDFYSRIAQDGYWICIHADEIEGSAAEVRFNEKISDLYSSKKIEPQPNKSTIEIAMNLWDGEMNQSTWVEAIDRSYF